MTSPIAWSTSGIDTTTRQLLIRKRSYVDAAASTLVLMNTPSSKLIVPVPNKYLRVLHMVSYECEVLKHALTILEKDPKVDNEPGVTFLYRHLKYLDDVRSAFVKQAKATSVGDPSWRCPTLDYHLWLQVTVERFDEEARKELLKMHTVDFTYVTINWEQWKEDQAASTFDSTGVNVDYMGPDPITAPPDVAVKISEFIIQKAETSFTSSNKDGEAAPQKSAQSGLTVASNTASSTKRKGKARADPDSGNLNAYSGRWNTMMSGLMSNIRSHLQDKCGIDIDDYRDAEAIENLIETQPENGDVATKNALSVLLVAVQGLSATPKDDHPVSGSVDMVDVSLNQAVVSEGRTGQAMTRGAWRTADAGITVTDGVGSSGAAGTHKHSRASSAETQSTDDETSPSSKRSRRSNSIFEDSSTHFGQNIAAQELIATGEHHPTLEQMNTDDVQLAFDSVTMEEIHPAQLSDLEGWAGQSTTLDPEGWDSQSMVLDPVGWAGQSTMLNPESGAGQTTQSVDDREASAVEWDKWIVFPEDKQKGAVGSNRGPVISIYVLRQKSSKNGPRRDSTVNLRRRPRGRRGKAW
ncbi:hypothetical protein CONPUDRAFT_78298 [Coniophora puteana RWD-64-598 SS2]|uniref:Uncharacterized protein n=1 Tax=Coniophora puteana (strain RWD-64-598) TaxID=741705 RepID=R7SE73_CONPW|nr:uncharacterized protein CONPUDRAFT_78298 [Coniophora puteana RWD-64-598 SS2]EIW74155.1 hypothetical protein CONPUDRAFT_78298 [Coniophora puteana RWD-64-598 SS2]